jgi:hypothetical protein
MDTMGAFDTTPPSALGAVFDEDVSKGERKQLPPRSYREMR